MLECLDFFPFGITHVLTDNGLEFTNRLLKNKKGEYCTKPSKLHVFCKKNNIDHRCTKPFTPKTNGMVEKANDIIKSKTIKMTIYNTIEEMNRDLMGFLVLILKILSTEFVVLTIIVRPITLTFDGLIVKMLKQALIQDLQLP